MTLHEMEETLTAEVDRWYAYQWAGGYPIEFYKLPPTLDEHGEIANGEEWVLKNLICRIEDYVLSVWGGLGGTKFGDGCRVVPIPKNPFSVAKEVNDGCSRS